MRNAQDVFDDVPMLLLDTTDKFCELAEQIYGEKVSQTIRNNIASSYAAKCLMKNELLYSNLFQACIYHVCEFLPELYKKSGMGRYAFTQYFLKELEKMLDSITKGVDIETQRKY
jgi:hypothetical protein